MVTEDFVNRGMFATHYLRSMSFKNSSHESNLDSFVEPVRKEIGTMLGMFDDGGRHDAKARRGEIDRLLRSLGWDGAGKTDGVGGVFVTTTEKSDLNTNSSGTAPPSFAAVAALRGSEITWSILTNGRTWRLYSNRVSASSTNYFEITPDPSNDRTIMYLILMFGALSFKIPPGLGQKIPDMELFLNESRNFTKSLEESLSSSTLGQDGIFLDFVKGILNHDPDHAMKRTRREMESAKHSAIKIIYRIWFLAYAEARNLLPMRNEKYRHASLQAIRMQLDGFEDDQSSDKCWRRLLDLFALIRDGNPDCNLPRYNGKLFKEDVAIDGVSIKNKFVARALRGLLERDGEMIDYGCLGVRHFGNTFESLLDLTVRQAEDGMLLLEDKNGVKEVKSKTDSTHPYKKNDLYLISKSGTLSRKTSASFYTPEKIVKFLVKRGLEPIFEERMKKIQGDLMDYEKCKSDRTRKACIDRILDMRVLDPAMGSGHFLVEVLNQITVWSTAILDKYQNHPLLTDLEKDQKDVVAEQKKKGASIDENLLTLDVLLKRKVMKRCIFGVDLNPMAVELAKVSLWLDSFAIGMPLTYMDHHIRYGDSTIGMRLVGPDAPAISENHTLDVWAGDDMERSSKLFAGIVRNSDATIESVVRSQNQYGKYRRQTRWHRMLLDVLAALKMDPDTIPKNVKDVPSYLQRIADVHVGNKKDASGKIGEIIKEVSAKSKMYGFFHWDMEMVDAFTDRRPGFDAIVGNPPWDKIRPNKKEFFDSVDFGYRKRTNKEKIKIQRQYAPQYEEYRRRIDYRRAFYKNRGGMGENTDYEIYRIVLERMLEVLAPGGIISMVIPSAITNSRGATKLRQHILGRRILSLRVFENRLAGRKKVFPIDSRQRFALLTVQNQGNTEFDAGFYLDSFAQLEDLDTKHVRLSRDMINSMSPDMSIIPEARSMKDFAILKKIYSQHTRLKEMKGWSVDLGRELNLGEDKDKRLLKGEGKKDKNARTWPVLESKNFHQHIYLYAKPTNHAVVERTAKRVKSIKKFNGQSEEIHENPRLIYRSISSSTNTRTMIACIAPASVFTTVNTYMAIPRIGTFEIDQAYHKLNAYLCGIFNSTTYDYILRPKIDKAVETYQILETPVPETHDDKIACKISRLSAVLALSEVWHSDLAGIFNIRQNDVKNITLQKRIEITSRIDALAAIHYGLKRDEYQHILADFKFKKMPFNTDELSSTTDYQNMKDADRDMFMRRFYGEVYEQALSNYDRESKATSKKNHISEDGTE